MSKDGVISLGPAKRFKWWQLNEVSLGAVEGPAAAVADIGAGRGKERLGMRDAGFRVKREIAGRKDAVRQVLDLLGVEDGVVFQEGDLLLGLLAAFAGDRPPRTGPI